MAGQRRMDGRRTKAAGTLGSQGYGRRVFVHKTATAWWSKGGYGGRRAWAAREVVKSTDRGRGKRNEGARKYETPRHAWRLFYDLR